MTRSAIPVENLVGGISEQPKKLRFRTQMERQENFIGTVLRGLEPRQHTSHVTKLLGSLPLSTAWHIIDRDEEEKYLVVLRNYKVQVFDLFGNEYPIHGPDAPYTPSYGYLDTTRGNGNALEDDLLRPAWPSCWASSAWQKLADETCAASVDLGPFNLGKAYKLSTGVSASEIQLFDDRLSWPGVGKWVNFSVFLKADEIDEVTIHLINFNGPTQYGTSFSLLTDALDPAPSNVVVSKENYGNGWYRCRVSRRSQLGVDPGWGLGLYVRSGTTYAVGEGFLAYGPFLTISDEAELPPYTLGQNVLRALTVADTTWVLNTAHQPAMDPTLSTSFDKQRAFAAINQGSYDTIYRINFAVNGGGTSTAYVQTWDGSSPGSGINMSADTIQTQHIAADLKTQLDLLGAPITVNLIDNVIEVIGSLTSTTIDKFEVTDSGGDSLTRTVWKKVPAVSDLPLSCRDRFKVEIIPEEIDTDAETSWVQFRADSGVATAEGQGTWVETLPDGIEYKIDPTTMPHTLVRREDDGAGTVTGTPYALYFEWGPATWTDRIVGDDSSNPLPSFLDGLSALPHSRPGRWIADMFFHKNRLGFLSGTNLILSSAGNYGNFWRTTVQTLPDDDPIDIGAGRAGVLRLLHTAELERVLLIFADSEQMRLDGGNVLSPSSAAIVAEAHYPTYHKAEPVALGRSVFFPYFRVGNSGVYEFTPNQEKDTFDPLDHNTHVPSLIPGQIRTLSGTEEEKVLVAVSEDEPGTLFVFKYDDAGIRRIQNAWARFTFGPVSILHAGFVRSSLYMVVHRADGVFLEVLDMSPKRKDTDADFMVRLDRRVTEVECTDVYSAGSDQTTITLPYLIEPGDTVVVTERATDTNGLQHGLPLTVVSAAGDQVVVEGQLTEYFVGSTYLCEAEMTPPVWLEGPDDGSSLPSITGSLKLRRLYALFNDTSFIEVVSSPDDYPQRVMEFTGKGYGEKVFDAVDMAEAEHAFPLYGDAKEAKVTWRTQSHLPAQILSAEWGVTRRSREKQARR